AAKRRFRHWKFGAVELAGCACLWLELLRLRHFWKRCCLQHRRGHHRSACEQQIAAANAPMSFWRLAVRLFAFLTSSHRTFLLVAERRNEQKLPTGHIF